MKNTVVKNSAVDGKGLFALNNFKIGDVIEPVEGNIVLGWSKSKYSIRLAGRRSLLLTNKTKFVNHSNDPNVVFQLRGLSGKLVAIKSIAAGEELLSMYESIF